MISNRYCSASSAPHPPHTFIAPLKPYTVSFWLAPWLRRGLPWSSWFASLQLHAAEERCQHQGRGSVQTDTDDTSNTHEGLELHGLALAWPAAGVQCEEVVFITGDLRVL